MTDYLTSHGATSQARRQISLQVFFIAQIKMSPWMLSPDT